MENKGYANFGWGGGGGGGVNKVHYGKCGGWRILSYSPPSPHGAFDGY